MAQFVLDKLGFALWLVGFVTMTLGFLLAIPLTAAWHRLVHRPGLRALAPERPTAGARHRWR